MFKYELCEEIKKILENAELDEISIGCSDSQVFKINKKEEVYFLKISREGLLTREYTALKWLDGKLSVPKIVLYSLKNGVEALITESLQGKMVCDDDMLNNPELGIKIISEAFQNLYKIDYSTCPFNVGLDYKLNLVKNNVQNGLINYNELPSDVKNKYDSLDDILKYLEDNKFEEELCFSHGDVSLPNVFCKDGKFSGFIDVGECGVADKWFDLAICQKSIVRNFGSEFVPKLYEKLNIIPDYNKINYYLLMMELYL